MTPPPPLPPRKASNSSSAQISTDTPINTQLKPKGILKSANNSGIKVIKGMAFDEKASVGEIEGEDVSDKPRENPIITLILKSFHWVSQAMSNFVTSIENLFISSENNVSSNMEGTDNLGFENDGPKQGEGFAQNNKTIDQISIKADLDTLTGKENIANKVKQKMTSAIKQSVLDQAKELRMDASSEKGKFIIKFDPPITKEQGKQLRETAEENTDILLKYIKQSGELDTKTKDDFIQTLKQINSNVESGTEKDEAITWKAERDDNYLDISNIDLEGVAIGDNSEQGSHTGQLTRSSEITRNSDKSP